MIFYTIFVTNSVIKFIVNSAHTRVFIHACARASTISIIVTTASLESYCYCVGPIYYRITTVQVYWENKTFKFQFTKCIISIYCSSRFQWQVFPLWLMPWNGFRFVWQFFAFSFFNSVWLSKLAWITIKWIVWLLVQVFLNCLFRLHVSVLSHRHSVTYMIKSNMYHVTQAGVHTHPQIWNTNNTTLIFVNIQLGMSVWCYLTEGSEMPR